MWLPSGVSSVLTRGSGRILYAPPAAVVPSDHKCSGPEQHHFILLVHDQVSKTVSLAKVKVEFLLQLWRTIHFRASSKSPHASADPWPLLLFMACNRMPSNLNQLQHSFIRTQNNPGQSYLSIPNHTCKCLYSFSF